MKTKIFIASIVLLIMSITSFAQKGDSPVFSTSDKLDEFGEWQTSRQLTVKGEKDQQIAISYRHKVVKKFALTCKYTVEVRNDSDKKIEFYYLAGNDRTNMYAGSVGTIKEKVKLKPGEVKVIDYPLPTKNFKADSDAEVCQKCKELSHGIFFGDLEAK